MAIVVIGVNHRSTPLALIERFAFGADELPKVLADVSQRDHVAEAVVVSTCNRTEIYAVVDRFHDAFSGLRAVLAECADVGVAELADHLDVEFDEAAIGHLFAVASGLDSAVIGETEILGQLKVAWSLARTEGTVGPQLDDLFRHALHVGKRARSETGISRSIASASAAAVALAGQRLGGVEGRRALVVGAGDMSAQMAVALRGAGIGQIKVANRTPERAIELAQRIGGDPVPFDEIASELETADLVLTSTGASTQVVNRATIERALPARRGRPLLIVDIAVPRDVDPDVASLDGIDLCDMDDLRAFTDAGIARRRGEVTAVREIIQDEILRFEAQRNARSVAPIIAALHARAEELRLAELDRFGGRLDTLTDRQRDAVEQLTHGIVAKLLHRPSVRLGELAGGVRGDRIVDALRDLYELDDSEPRADHS